MVTQEWAQLKDPGNPTEQDLFDTLAGTNLIVMRSSADHPVFAQLRARLGELGYIKIVTSSWNSDQVLKPFTLNGREFKPNESFPCASAISWVLNHPTV